MTFFHGAENAWSPSPEFYRDDADAVMFFLQGNSVTAAEPIDDPLFSAHQPHVTPGYYGNSTLYLPDNPANVLACTEQHQFCNPNLSRQTGCTPLTGMTPAHNASRNIGGNAQQLATIDLLFDIIYLWSASLVIINIESPPN